MMGGGGGDWVKIWEVKGLGDICWRSIVVLVIV